MLKKAAAQNTFKEQYEKLSQRLKVNIEDVDKLLKATAVPGFSAVPDPNALQNLLAECEDSEFWQNFKKAAPIIFCTAIESDQNLKQVRDMSFIDELLRTNSLLKLMSGKIEKGDADVDIVEYSLATKMLESKLAILHALNINIDSGDDNKITLNVKGSKKAIQIDINKLKEAITVVDTQVEETTDSLEEKKGTELETIPLDISEEEFLNKAAEKIGTIQKAGKTLSKDSFIKIFKYTGDFAKLKSKELKKKAQENRVAFFGKDHKKYMEALKQSVMEEESAYEQASQVMFDKLCISPEMFERSQQELMMDPYASMELFNLGINMEAPGTKAPESLTKEKTIEIVKASNDYAFDLFKKEYIDQLRTDPMMMPVLISAIAHDWVYKEHGYTEDEFKAALFEHKIYEDP